MYRFKHVIWTNYELDFDDWKDDLEEEYPDKDEDELVDLMYEINKDYLDDERMNLDINLNRPIIVIADLGLWDGRHKGYKIIESGNIKDCLYSESDYSTWYVDDLFNLRYTGIHHDGRNEYLYRVFKKGVTDSQIENLEEKIYNGTVTRKDITRVTERLGDYIGDVYGWEMRGKKQRKAV